MPQTAMKRKSKKSSNTRKATRTFVSFVLDASGSMQEQKNSAISGFNEYTSGLKADGSVAFTLTTFNTSCTIVHDCLPIKDVPNLTDGVYKPDGWTALFDAVGDTIEAVARKIGKDDRALVVILTDGHENSSRRFTHATIRDLIQSKQKDGNWTFVFLGATADAWDIGAGLGIAAGNNVKYDTKNTRQTMRAVADSTHALCASDDRSSMRFCASAAASWSAANAGIQDGSA